MKDPFNIRTLIWEYPTYRHPHLWRPPRLGFSLEVIPRSTRIESRIRNPCSTFVKEPENPESPLLQQLCAEKTGGFLCRAENRFKYLEI